MNLRPAPQSFASALLLAAFVTGLALVAAAPDGRAAAAAASAPASSSPASAAVAASPPASVNGSVRAASAAAATIAASAPATAAAASAAPAASNGTAATTQTAPVRPAASQPSVPLPPRLTTCVAILADPDKCGPLTLERDPVTLPHASLGRPYARVIRAEGGLPPYEFDLMQGNLPGGLTLDMYGRIVGTPDQPGSSRFRVRVVDAAGDIASQSYSLRVTDPTKATAKPAAKPASAASAAQLSQLDLSHAGPPANAAPTAHVYQLETAQLDALKTAIKSAEPPIETLPPDPDAPPEAAPEPAAAASAPTPPPPATLVWSDAQQAQLEALLKPVMAVEYPSRSLFEAAVDAQVCAHARQLIVHEAQRLKQQPPSKKDVTDVCAPSAKPAPATTPKTAAKPASAVSATAPAASSAASDVIPVGWRELPSWLMPPGLRDWLVAAAARHQPLLPDKPVPWTATPSCNCAAPRPQQPLYALYPAWRADGPQPQALDFSLINRITYFALPLGDEQALNQVEAWDEAHTAFIRAAHDHETRVDFGIYQADWSFLATEPAAARDELLRELTTHTQVPRRIRELLDTRLPGLASRAKAWLPGFAQVQRMGDGVTVFFDNLPDAQSEPELAKRFAKFYPNFVKGLAEAMGETPDRKYAINLVMSDSQFLNASPFDAPQLFELLKAVEDPEMADGHIVENNGDYKRRSNVELRFLILLSEPTIDSGKGLRRHIEARLQSGDQRVFLRSVVPVLVLPQASPQQYRDDVDYAQDNFGGLGFWPAPLMGPHFDAAQAKELRANFGPDPGSGVGEAVCGVVCPNRWLFRLAFELLLLAWAVWFALLQWRCEWRSRYGRYSLLGAIPPLLVGAALLQCDPALEALRKGNAQLIALIAIPSLAALWALLKRKEDKP